MSAKAGWSTPMHHYIMIRDPDGYAVGINQWGDAEHQAWLERLEKKRAAGIIP